MKNQIEKNNTYTFSVAGDVYTVQAPNELLAMAKMNIEVIEKKGLKPMKWIGHKEDKTIQEKSFYYKKKEMLINN